MKKEYVTPPYSEEMKRVCNVISNKFDSIVSQLMEDGKSENDAKKLAREVLTQNIQLPA